MGPAGTGKTHTLTALGGLPVLGLIASMTAPRCERWDMALWQDADQVRNKWNCDCWFGIDADREVAFQIAVKMNQGTTPRWTLSAGFTGL